MTIGKFQQLRELELASIWPNSTHEILLSSITSTELRKVIFSMTWEDWGISLANMQGWDSIIDKQLCGLVDRLRAMGYHHTLEAELRVVKRGRLDSGSGGYGFTRYLPKFREKGVVIVVDAANGDQVVHSSKYVE